MVIDVVGEEFEVRDVELRVMEKVFGIVGEGIGILIVGGFFLVDLVEEWKVGEVLNCEREVL